MERVYLEFREGTSDKFYRIIALENSAGMWITTVWWGRRGSTGQTQLKYEGPSQVAAVACMHDIADQKRAKGYHDALDPLSPAAPSAPAPTVSPAYGTPLKRPPLPNPYAAAKAGLAAFNAAQPIPGVPGFPAMKAAEKEVNWDHLHDYVMEEKFDGHRAGLTFQPDGTIQIRNVYGQNKSRIENTPHIEAALRAIAHTRPSSNLLYDGTLIDGELVGLTLEETTHLLGGSGRNDPRLRFVAFDLPYLAGEDLRGKTWAERRSLLTDLIDNHMGPIELASLYPPDPEIVQGIWSRGGEGAILKPLTSKYVPAGRADWIKIKEHHTADAVITGWAPGAGKYSNQIGALKLSQFVNGALTEVTKVSGMTDADRAHMSKHFDTAWLGTVVEFEYQKKTGISYRHPRYVRRRLDKQPLDCVWDTSP